MLLELAEPEMEHDAEETAPVTGDWRLGAGNETKNKTANKNKLVVGFE